MKARRTKILTVLGITILDIAILLGAGFLYTEQ